jgi:hypothetical protein
LLEAVPYFSFSQFVTVSISGDITTHDSRRDHRKKRITSVKPLISPPIMGYRIPGQG